MSDRNYGWVDKTGEMSGRNVIGEVTEAVQSFIKSSWEKYTGEARPPTIQEDLTYESMDRNEQVVFVYMYRLATNPNLQNQEAMETGSCDVERRPCYRRSLLSQTTSFGRFVLFDICTCQISF